MKRPRRLLSWNVKVNRRPALVVLALWAFIRTRRPDVIVLCEATRYAPDIREAFRKDWRTYRRGADVVVMVRRTLPEPDVTRLDHDIAWHGPHAGIAHNGRKWLQLDFPGLRLVAVHRVPGGPSGGIQTRGANRPAWEAEDFLLATAVSTTTPVLIVGDQNARVSEMADFMARHNLRPVRTGAKVDWAMRRKVAVKGKRLSRRGSDHPACLYTLP
jgi:endonuclease/exonuclease/phosphatase (EEP) superfamily protein YafD